MCARTECMSLEEINSGKLWILQISGCLLQPNQFSSIKIDMVHNIFIEKTLQRLPSQPSSQAMQYLSSTDGRSSNAIFSESRFTFKVPAKTVFKIDGSKQSQNGCSSKRFVLVGTIMKYPMFLRLIFYIAFYMYRSIQLK